MCCHVQAVGLDRNPDGLPHTYGCYMNVQATLDPLASLLDPPAVLQQRTVATVHNKLDSNTSTLVIIQP